MLNLILYRERIPLSLKTRTWETLESAGKIRNNKKYLPETLFFSDM